MTKHTYVVMGSKLSFTYDNKVYSIDKTADLAYEQVLQALLDGREKDAYDAYKTHTLQAGNITVKRNGMVVDGLGTKVTLDSVFAEAYLYARSEGKASEDLLERFFTNVAANPNHESREGLSNFMAKARMPITDRGTFLAYRYVSDTYYDRQTGSMDNMVGNDVKMDRNKCDSNANVTCSSGLHVCHHEYVNGIYGSGLPHLVVEVNPRDVVAVPTDYNYTKMRVCRFRPLCKLDYFKQQLMLNVQAALGAVPVFMTEQTRSWKCETGIPEQFLSRYKPVDAWEWAKA